MTTEILGTLEGTVLSQIAGKETRKKGVYMIIKREINLSVYIIYIYIRQFYKLYFENYISTPFSEYERITFVRSNECCKNSWTPWRALDVSSLDINYRLML